MKFKSLRKTINLRICLAIILLAIVIIGIGFVSLNMTYTRFYQEKALDIATMTAAMVDGDRIGQYEKTLTKDDYYNDLQIRLNDIKQELSDADYLYICVPHENYWVYIMEARAERDDMSEITISELGEVYEYREADYDKMVGHMDEAMSMVMNYQGQNHEKLISAWAPIYDSDQNIAAVAGVDFRYTPVLMGILRFSLFIAVGFVLAIVLIAVFMIVTVERKVVSPIRRITDYINSYESGNATGTKPEIKDNNELKYLSDSFSDTIDKNTRYIDYITNITAERERTEADMNVVQNIQASMLPSKFPAFPERTEFDIYATLQIAGNMSSNFYDFFLVDQNHLALVIGDINGAGIPAALLMVITRTLIKNYARLVFEPEKVFVETNNQLSESNEGMTTAAFLGILNLSTGLFCYVNGGHCVPLLKHAGGEFEPLSAKDCFVLGSMAGVPYWQQSVQMTQGDLLFFYTKGLTDAENKEKMQYSEGHMRQRLNQTLSQVYELKDILELMQEDVREFLGGDLHGQEDMTMLILRYFG